MSEEKPRAQQVRPPHLPVVPGVLDAHCEALIKLSGSGTRCRVTG
jgi:hypothetical protein